MNKKAYIIPALCVTKLNVENMIAVSGPAMSTNSASQDAGMEVKVDRPSYNVWDDDWSN